MRGALALAWACALLLLFGAQPGLAERGRPVSPDGDASAQSGGVSSPGVEGGSLATAYEQVVAEGSANPPSVLAPPLPEPAIPSVPTMRADGYRSEIEAAWFSGGTDLARRAYLARNAAMRLGAGNVEAAARALLAAEADDETHLDHAQLAVALAPDVPSFRMTLALAQLRAGSYGEAVRETVHGLAAIPRNLEATLWLASSLLAMFAAVLVTGPLLFILWVGVGLFRHGAHDLGDLISSEMPDFARGALLASVLLVSVALGEGVMGLALAFFALGFTYADAKCRRALALAATMLLLGLYPLAQLTGRAISAVDSDPVALAAHAVVRGIASPSDVELLAVVEDRDALAESALALWERRAGSREAAMARYAKLLIDHPRDPVVLAGLANMHFERGEDERSIELSEQAAGVLRSATLLFNLSQVYARSFRMDEFEGALAQAQALDTEAIAALSRTAAPDFVADLPFNIQPIYTRLLESSDDDAFLATTSRLLMPGWLGSSGTATSAGFGLAALMGLILGRRWEHSSSCRRCGHRICSRCEATVWNNEICEGCHHLFHRPEATHPEMRSARLAQLRMRERRTNRASLVSSLLVPGVGGLLARRPDLSLLALFFFAWGVVLFVWRTGFVPDPLVVGAAGPLAFMLAGALVVLCYATTVATGLWVRRSL